MSGLSILVVEDDAMVAMLLSDLLGMSGHTVCATASTEAEAVDCALRLAPDLMLVDLGLADGDGARVMQTILRERRQPHLFITGARRADLPAGAHVLEKPFLADDLLRAIDAAATGAPASSDGDRG